MMRREETISKLAMGLSGRAGELPVGRYAGATRSALGEIATTISAERGQSARGRSNCLPPLSRNPMAAR